MIYLGIDPGVSGGLCAMRGNNLVLISMPDELEGVWGWISACGDIFRSEGGYAVIEKVSGWMGGNRKGDGSEATSQGAPGSTMFTFGASYGALKMALIASGIPFEAVTPQVWQKPLSLLSRKEVGPQGHKRALRDEAQRLFPEEKVTLKNCDALLLCNYCRTSKGGA